MVTSSPDLPSRLSPADLELRDLTSRPRAGTAPALAPHGERITLSDCARDLGQGQPPHARGDVRWYRAARPAGHADRGGPARGRVRPPASLPPPPFSLPGGRHARSAIEAYRAGMDLPG